MNRSFCLALLAGLALYAHSLSAQGDVPFPREQLVLWLDAEPTALFADLEGTQSVDGKTPVAYWRDKGPRAHRATQEIELARPDYVPDVRGGRGAVRFDGVSKFLHIDSVANLFQQEQWTAFAVAQAEEVEDDGTMLMASGVPERSRRGLRFMPNCGPARCLEFKSKADENEDIRSEKRLSSDWLLWEFHNDRGLVSIGTNGAVEATGMIRHDEIAELKRALVGGRPDRNNGGTENWNGHIGEILVFDNALSEEEREAVRSYLATKWSLDIEPAGDEGD